MKSYKLVHLQDYVLKMHNYFTEETKKFFFCLCLKVMQFR